MPKHHKQAKRRRSPGDATDQPAPMTEPRSPATRSGFPAWIRAHKVLSAIVAVGLLTVTVAALRYLDEDAKRQRLLAVKDRSMLSAINPFMPDPTPTPQLSKEYIYAGSRLLAVEDANANAAPPADLAVWRPSNGTFYVLGGTQGPNQQTAYAWGMSGDVPVPGDFDGDGKTDFAIWRPGSTGVWYIVPSSTGSYYTVNLGTTGDVPAVADFDGDGKTDVALWRPGSTAVWYIVHSSTNTQVSPSWGTTDDKPVPHDYDGDGLADVAVWRSSNNTFYSLNTIDSGYQTVQLGSGSPAPCDYDGDAKADFATFASGYWTIRFSGTSSTSNYTYGTTNDIPVQNDYDADGLCDRAIFRPAGSAQWWIRKSKTDSDRTEYWGTTDDKPVPAYYRR